CGSANFGPPPACSYNQRGPKAFRGPRPGWSRVSAQEGIAMLETRVIGNIHVLTPTKNLVGGDETEFLKATVAGLSSGGSPHVVVDLGKISWISSLGISGLIRARKDCMDHHGWLRLARAGKRIDHIILTGRLSALFDLFNTVEDAVREPGRDAAA